MFTVQRPKLGEMGKLVARKAMSQLRANASDVQLTLLSAATILLPNLLSLGLVAGMTLCLLVITHFIELQHVSSAYLIPVLIAAISLGVVPAVVAAVGGVGASAFFFYAPIYDFRVENPAQLLDLPLFVIVATVTGKLAARIHSHALLADEREKAMRALYAFSRRLAVAIDAAQIYAAIQDHLREITGCRVVYFAADSPEAAPRSQDEIVPEIVQRAVVQFAQKHDRTGILVRDGSTASKWLIRAVSQSNAAFGLVAIDAGRVSPHGYLSMQRIDVVLADAAATLERLDVVRIIGEAKLRTEAEILRAALIGSVSHGLRTPLASIIGSASILAQAPAIAREPRLESLAGIVRDEAERLNSDIQRLLDASRISSAGVHPQMAWADASDIVNAAVASQQRRLIGRQITLRLTDDLPLVHVDAVLIEQALIQIIDNARKYSPVDRAISIETRGRAEEIDISVGDEGVGVSNDEVDQIFERFYRGPRTREATSGSGLGLWIARAFVVACGGRLEAASRGEGAGTVVTITLPVAALPSGEQDD